MRKHHFFFVFICSLFLSKDSVASASNEHWEKNQSDSDDDDGVYYRHFPEPVVPNKGKKADNDNVTDDSTSEESKKAKKSSFSFSSLLPFSSRKKEKPSALPNPHVTQKALSIELSAVLENREPPRVVRTREPMLKKTVLRDGTPRANSQVLNRIKKNDDGQGSVGGSLETTKGKQSVKPNIPLRELKLDLKNIESYQERQKKRTRQQKVSRTKSTTRSPTLKSNSEPLPTSKSRDEEPASPSVQSAKKHFGYEESASSPSSSSQSSGRNLSDHNGTDDGVQLSHRKKDAGHTPKADSKRSVKDLFTPRTFSPRLSNLTKTPRTPRTPKTPDSASPRTPSSAETRGSLKSPRSPSSSEARGTPKSPRVLSPRLFGKKHDSSPKKPTNRHSKSQKKESEEKELKPAPRRKSATDLGVSTNFREALEGMNKSQKAVEIKQIYEQWGENKLFTMNIQYSGKKTTETLLNVYECLHENMYAHGKPADETMRAYVKTYLLYKLLYLEKTKKLDDKAKRAIDTLAPMRQNMENALVRIIFYTDTYMFKDKIETQLNRIASYFNYLGDATHLLDGSPHDKNVFSRKIFEKIMDEIPQDHFLKVQGMNKKKDLNKTFEIHAQDYFEIYKKKKDKEQKNIDEASESEPQKHKSSDSSNSSNVAHSSQSSSSPQSPSSSEASSSPQSPSSPQDDIKIAASSSASVQE